MNHRRLRNAIILAVVIVVWFTAVDWSWFVESCPNCGYDCDVTQYRVLTIPLNETIYPYESIPQLVAEDLGVACQHPTMQRWHKHRWWGLCMCKGPCINGIYRLSGGDSWYNDEVSRKIQRLALEDNSISDQFAQRVLRDHDFTFTETVLVRAGVDKDTEKKKLATN